MLGQLATPVTPPRTLAVETTEEPSPSMPEQVDREQVEPEQVEAAAVCYVERAAFNPAFWNTPDVVGRSNCYNYASNRRTDAFAQSGRPCGSQYRQLSCAEVTRGALCDSTRRSGDCVPDSERLRRFMALVIAPGYDYRPLTAAHTYSFAGTSTRGVLCGLGEVEVSTKLGD